MAPVFYTFLPRKEQRTQPFSKCSVSGIAWNSTSIRANAFFLSLHSSPFLNSPILPFDFPSSPFLTQDLTCEFPRLVKACSLSNLFLSILYNLSFNISLIFCRK